MWLAVSQDLSTHASPTPAGQKNREQVALSNTQRDTPLGGVCGEFLAMTIAISTKVQAGVALGTDTATTFVGPDGRPLKIYYNAHKLFEMHGQLPIGAITWGLGSIGQYSIADMAKQLRGRFGEAGSPFYVDPASYTIQAAAELVRRFVYEVVYRSVLGTKGTGSELGLIVAGYSANTELPEEWEIVIDRRGRCGPPKRLGKPNEYGVTARGRPEAVNLLLNAYSEDFFKRVAVDAGVTPAQIKRMLDTYRRLRDFRMPAQPGMPIRDAIELVCYLVETEIGYRRFIPDEAAPTVGGHVEVAAITRYEGFRWVHRIDDFVSPKPLP